MRVLVLGSGGREHALGWKLAQSPQMCKLFFAPGNPGTAKLGQNVSLPNHADILAFARDEAIELVIVGPEKDLVLGIADKLSEIGVPCFGPCKAAALLEGSKEFAKQVMDRVGIPTAHYGCFEDYEKAVAYVDQNSLPLVVKADGLAGGKGVTICETREDAIKALRESLLDKRFGESGSKVIIEEFLTGTEASFHIICDGQNMQALPTAQDHKALLEGNLGPNTGGMGTCSPNPVMTEAISREVMEQIARPVFAYFNEQGSPFRGVLFVGLMLTWHGPKVLEFNVRFGDPETQVMMPMLQADLLPILYQAACGELKVETLALSQHAAVCVVLAAEGYPQSPRTGDLISDVPEDRERLAVFHAGTATDAAGQLVTAGGRVMGVTAWADDIERARKRAYKAANQISFYGKYMRKDIGLRI